MWNRKRDEIERYQAAYTSTSNELFAVRRRVKRAEKARDAALEKHASVLERIERERAGALKEFQYEVSVAGVQKFGKRWRADCAGREYLSVRSTDEAGDVSRAGGSVLAKDEGEARLRVRWAVDAVAGSGGWLVSVEVRRYFRPSLGDLL